MKRASLVPFGLALVASCGGGTNGTGEPVDGSTDAGSPIDDVAAAESDGDAASVDIDAAEATVPDPCAKASVPAATLDCTGLYADFANKQIAATAIEYTPSTPLWSDGAQKQRWIVLPPHTQIDITNPSEWSFPVGAKLFKEFRVNGHRVETRMFQKVDKTFWNYATYAWSRDESSATINFGGPVPVGDGGATWKIPTNDDCNECHRGRLDRILGFEQVSLGLPDAQGLTLARLAEMGLVTPTPARASLSIGDDGTGLAALALGWIHVNCGVTCHNANPSAAGYGARMILRLDPTDLDGSPPNAATWSILNTTLGVPCVSGSLIGQPRIQPGDTANSEIYQLISQRGPLQMPPIASLLVDTTDVAVVASWIRSLANDAGAPSEDAGASDAGASDAAVSDAAAPTEVDAGAQDDASAPTEVEAGAQDDVSAEAGDVEYQAPDGDMPDADNPDGGAPEDDAAGD